MSYHQRIRLFGAALALLTIGMPAVAVELVIGEESVRPGITFIFEGAPKDRIYPDGMHLAQKRTDVHIEARVNWQKDNIPEGTPPEGFVGYLRITAEVINQRTGRALLVDLTPHLNLIDNLHYARNIALPGSPKDRYRVIFRIRPSEQLALHQDWVKKYGKQLMKPQTFTYRNVDFEKIARATR